MKNFTVYSKKDLKKIFNLKELLNVRYIKNGIRLAYITYITGIIYAISRKLYSLAIILVLMLILFEVASSMFPDYRNIIFILETILNCGLVLFGNDIEEFFLKRKGFLFQGVAFAKNMSEVRFSIEEVIKLKP